MHRLLSMLAILAACAGEAPAPPPREIPLVHATFYPLAFFAQRIGGALIEVRCPVQGDADPAHWKPDAATLKEMQGADLILANGAGFESWTSKVSLPEARFVETAAAFRTEWISFANSAVHSHGKEGAHSHEGIDGHTWLDPLNAKRQARAVLDALTHLLPAHTSEMEARYAVLAKDLDALNDLFGALPPVPPLLASHPAYNYLARRYSWKVESLDLDPEEAPTDDQVAAILAAAKAHGAGHILWESAPLAETSARLKPLVPVVVSPVESRPAEGDYLAAMRVNVTRLREALPPADR